MLKGWSAKKLGEVSEICSGFGFPKSLQGKQHGDYPFGKVGDISNIVRNGGQLIANARNYIDKEEVKKLRAKPFPAGTIVFAKIGEAIRQNFRALTGREMLFDNNVSGVIPNHQFIDPIFLLYFLKTVDLYPLAKTTSVPSINKSVLESIEIPLPSLPEQRSIVARIRECMERVEELEQLRAEAMKEAIGIYPSRCHDFFAPNERTEKWVSVSIGELAAFIQYGYTQSSTKAPIGPQFLRITDIQNHTVNWDSVPYCEADSKQTAKYKLAKNDILFARTGATTGKSFLIENEPPLSVFASYLIRLQLNQEQVLPRLIYHFFQSPLYWDQIHQNMRGGAQPNINSKVLASIKLAIPEDLEEQREIVDRLDEAFSISMELIDLQQRQNEALRFMRESILRKAFAGEL